MRDDHTGKVETLILAALPAMRAGMAEQARALPSPAVAVSDEAADGVRVRLYMSPACDGGAASRPPLLMFLHGGAWVLGDLDTHDACCRWLCVESGWAVLAVGYRLAPEHPFPAGLDDVATAWRWAQREAAALGCDPGRIAIGGESAGANLAAALALRLREEGATPPLLQFLVHPPTDLLLEQPSIDAVALPGLSRDLLDACIAAYAGDHPRADPLLSPLRAPNLGGLPPAIVVTVEHDPLRDDGEHYALALARAGNEVNVQRLPGLPHGFMFLPVTDPAIAAAYRLLGERLARYAAAA